MFICLMIFSQHLMSMKLLLINNALNLNQINVIFYFQQTKKWFNQSYIINNNNIELDLKLIKNIGKNKLNPQVINGGIIFGGTKKVIKFLKIFNKYINPSKANDFGYDQVLITLLVSKKNFL